MASKMAKFVLVAALIATPALAFPRGGPNPHYRGYGGYAPSHIDVNIGIGGHRPFSNYGYAGYAGYGGNYYGGGHGGYQGRGYGGGFLGRGHAGGYRGHGVVEGHGYSGHGYSGHGYNVH